MNRRRCRRKFVGGVQSFVPRFSFTNALLLIVICSSVFAYYAERVFEGKPKKAKKAFDQLDAAERKTLKKEARKCMSEYMERLERYLKSLSKSVS